MSALSEGTQAPDFTLETVDGKKFSSQDALARGPLVLAFFKISCPVCQYTMPFLERIYRAYGNGMATLLGVSQDKRRGTQDFLKEYGITFPVLLDESESYPVSNAYGLTHVPTIFWIGQNHQVEISSVGWSRKDVEEIYRKIGASNGSAPLPLFKPGDDVPDFRAG